MKCIYNKAISLIFLLVFVPKPISKGCGPYYSFYGYSFINPKIIDLNKDAAPYFAGFEEVFRQLRPKEDIQQKDNLTEWQERFCGIPKLMDLQQVIYKASLSEMRLLKTAVQSETIPLDYRMRNNSFARHLEMDKCIEAVDYLIFAKRCEPYVVAQSSWESPKRDTVAMQFLIKDGLKEFKKIKSHYFKLRYAYQLIRLAHYKKNYAQTLELYDYLMPKIDNNPSIIEDWILGHKAGALMALGRNVEASYLYAKIFQNTPSKRASAYRSFKIKTNEEWTECLKLCKDDKERAILFALRASDPNSQVVEEMKQIYELAPDNEYLELLLVREMRKLEKDLLGLDFNPNKRDNQRYYKIPRRKAGENVVDLQQLVRVAATEEKVASPELWKIADGYLELLAGDYYAAKKTLEKLKGKLDNPILKEQLEAMIMVVTIDGLEQVNSQMEEIVGSYQKSPLFSKYPDFGKFVKDKLATLYRAQGYAGKAFLEQYTLRQLKYNPQLELIEELIGVAQKENRTKLENAMVLKEDGLTTIENDLWDMKGNYFLNQFQLESALEAYRQIPRKDRDDYGLFNPFREEFVDCINCRVIDTAGYNKVVILEQILELEYKAKADMEKGAAYYYQIGNVLYNMTYFGYAWKVSDYFRSGANWHYLKTGETVFSKMNAPFGNRELLNCSLPLYYYDKAYQLARTDELAAKAAFMAAKCQQNLFFTRPERDYEVNTNNIPYVPDAYRQYFNILKEHYTHTKFYEEVVQECLYYEQYAARN